MIVLGLSAMLIATSTLAAFSLLINLDSERRVLVDPVF